ncbi:MAG: MotA/TolQ/ExbB proton channel family protein [Deltaproteobacteria bacterium]|nr:MotA/TolQ/ExbB proton channel family protein [Deltaproteobacteria bacterium]
MEANSLWLSWWDSSGWVVRGVFLLLLGLSVVVWTIIISKSARIRQGLQVYAASSEGDAESSVSHPAEALFAEARRLKELSAQSPLPPAWAAERLRVAQRRAQMELDVGMTWLATIGSSAPFIGLLGTVWGIMHALQQLGGAEGLTLDRVAGPVGEALVATALGLFTAIPALWAYNLLLRGLRKLSLRLDDTRLELERSFQQKEG